MRPQPYPSGNGLYFEEYTKVVTDAEQCQLIAENDFNKLCVSELGMTAEYCVGAWDLTVIDYSDENHVCSVYIPAPVGSVGA